MKTTVKRKNKLEGRIKCHGNKDDCVRLVKMGYHRPLGKKTKKGTKPKKKEKKIYN